MKAIYILIILITDPATHTVQSVTTQEFVNQKACLSAEGFITYRRDELVSGCYPKYLKAKPWEEPHNVR
jgi:hypothetical protein